MTFKSVTSVSGIVCFKATSRPASTPWKPETSAYLQSSGRVGTAFEVYEYTARLASAERRRAHSRLPSLLRSMA